jgi:hypothetical protein
LPDPIIVIMKINVKFEIINLMKWGKY